MTKSNEVMFSLCMKKAQTFTSKSLGRAEETGFSKHSPKIQLSPTSKMVTLSTLELNMVLELFLINETKAEVHIILAKALFGSP